MPVEVVLIPNDEEIWHQAATWCLAEWHDVWPQDTLHTYIEHYRATATEPNRLPLVLAAMEGQDLLGVITLIDDDELPGATESPWLAACFVSAEHRGKGVGQLLVQECERLAAAMGHRALHLFTWSERHWYERQGWHVLREVDLGGRPTSVMVKDLVAQTNPPVQ
jgi:GNAT superfamily N-acetyltransferase